jgi:hypothetical protein
MLISVSKVARNFRCLSAVKMPTLCCSPVMARPPHHSQIRASFFEEAPAPYRLQYHAGSPEWPSADSTRAFPRSAFRATSSAHFGGAAVLLVLIVEHRQQSQHHSPQSRIRGYLLQTNTGFIWHTSSGLPFLLKVYSSVQTIVVDVRARSNWARCYSSDRKCKAGIVRIQTM